MRRIPMLAVICLSISAICVANAEEKWSIDTANPQGTPTTLIEYDTTEGTWISLDVAPDGQTIVFDLMGHLYEMPISGGQATALTQGRSWNLLPRYSPDGSEIAFTSDRDGADNIWLMDRADGSLSNLTKSSEPVVRGNWSADGRHIIASRLPRELTLHSEIYNRYGNKQELLKSEVFRYANQWVDDPARNVFYYEHNNARLPRDGARIYRYNKQTGEAEILIQRGGGAYNPHLSPSGRYLAYLGRNNLKTALYIRDLDSHADRLLLDGMDRDQMESIGYYGTGTGMDWVSDDELVLSHRGGIYRIDVNDGTLNQIPFKATISREINRSVRFDNTVAQGQQRTRIQRFAQITDRGVVSEALGDLYLTEADGDVKNLTNSAALESNPVYDANCGMLYYVTWTDRDGGAIVKRRLRGGSVQTLTDVASQYGALSLSADGKELAYLRGRQHTSQGKRLESQTVFELMLRDRSGNTTKVTEVNAAWGRGNTPEIRRASAIHFSADGRSLIFAEFGEDGLLLKQIGKDGQGERTLYHFPDASRAAVSPDGQWIAFREYQRFYLTPFEYVGKTRKVSADLKQGFSKRITQAEGVYLNWTADSQQIYWTRGTTLHQKSVADVFAEAEDATETTQDLAVTYDVAGPQGSIALTNARVISMDAQRQIHESATILITDNRIEGVGSQLEIPEDAEVFDLDGQTVMPGIVDAHGHYFGGNQSYLHVIEEHSPGLLAPLAFGVTTLFEVYGSAEKDAWIRDRLDAGLTAGPRLYTVGTPIFGAKYRPGLYRPVHSLEDARQVLSYNKAFGATSVKDYTMFTRKARHATVTAARELGLMDIAETAGNLAMNLTQVVDGISGLEHSMGMTPLYDDVLQFLAAAKVGITPTLLVVYNGPPGEQYFHHTERVWENPKLLQFLNKQELLRFRRPTYYWDDEHYAPKMAAALKPFYEAGVPLQMGAHGQMSGLDAHWEMELFHQGGFTPAQILEIATIKGAEYHGLDHELGSIEKGKLADLVILSADPLQDIRNARAIEKVMLNGVLYNGSDAARLHPEPAPAVRTYINP